MNGHPWSIFFVSFWWMVSKKCHWFKLVISKQVIICYLEYKKHFRKPKIKFWCWKLTLKKEFSTNESTPIYNRSHSLYFNLTDDSHLTCIFLKKELYLNLHMNENKNAPPKKDHPNMLEYCSLSVSCPAIPVALIHLSYIRLFKWLQAQFFYTVGL